jgi:hypothetical protein
LEDETYIYISFNNGIEKKKEKIEKEKIKFYFLEIKVEKYLNSKQEEFSTKRFIIE